MCSTRPIHDSVIGIYYTFSKKNKLEDGRNGAVPSKCMGIIQNEGGWNSDSVSLQLNGIDCMHQLAS